MFAFTNNKLNKSKMTKSNKSLSNMSNERERKSNSLPFYQFNHLLKSIRQQNKESILLIDIWLIENEFFREILLKPICSILTKGMATMVFFFKRTMNSLLSSQFSFFFDKIDIHSFISIFFTFSALNMTVMFFYSFSTHSISYINGL